MFLVTSKMLRKDDSSLTQEDLDSILQLKSNAPFRKELDKLMESSKILFRTTKVLDGQIVTETLYDSKKSYTSFRRRKVFKTFYNDVHENFKTVYTEEEI